MTEDMEQFKQDYPGMYQKFLDMNKALATLLREKNRRGGETEAQRTQEFPDAGDFPTILELE